MQTWADILDIAAGLPEVEESTWFGTPSLKVRKKSLCRLRTDPDALVIRVLDLEDQQALITGEPDVFFITPHYDGWPYVLVRLEHVDRTQIAELIEDAWRIQAPKRLVAAYDDRGGT